MLEFDRLEVTVYVDETDIGRVKVGQDATFTVDSYAKKFFKGIVREIRPKAMIKDHVVNYETILEFISNDVERCDINDKLLSNYIGAKRE